VAGSESGALFMCAILALSLSPCLPDFLSFLGLTLNTAVWSGVKIHGDFVARADISMQMCPDRHVEVRRAGNETAAHTVVSC
jgi:hypothetical protein